LFNLAADQFVMTAKEFEESIKKYKGTFHPVVPYEKADKFLLLEFTNKNTELTDEILKDTNLFTKYINSKLTTSGAKYGIGGYDEHRTIYSRSNVFDASPSNAPNRGESQTQPSLKQDVANNKGTPQSEVSERLSSSVEGSCMGPEPRRLHLGIDIWGKPYTKVMAPLNGIVHSFAFNNTFGDYGATIILTHNLDGITFHSLYGHLSLNSLKNLYEGQNIKKGDVFTEFGIPFENGQWPPHLHCQLILDMQGMKGDYPGVCKYSEREMYLKNCPDPDLILNMMQYAV
jgi:murein DD-endopeptidase MepM/ murein hydrolase activator NlpD